MATDSEIPPALPGSIPACIGPAAGDTWAGRFLALLVAGRGHFDAAASGPGLLPQPTTAAAAGGRGRWPPGQTGPVKLPAGRLDQACCQVVGALPVLRQGGAFSSAAVAGDLPRAAPPLRGGVCGPIQCMLLELNPARAAGVKACHGVSRRVAACPSEDAQAPCCFAVLLLRRPAVATGFLAHGGSRGHLWCGHR